MPFNDTVGNLTPARKPGADNAVKMKYLVSVIGGILLGGFVGALVGVGVEQVTQQSGWSLVVGTLGANGGAFWAAMRRAEGRALWRERSGG
jgi:hypothetical protein